MIDATPILKLLAWYRARALERMDPAETQRATLHSLLRRAQDTKFGRDHRFAHINSVEAYQRAVPLRTYDQLWTEYWKPSFPDVSNQTWPGKNRFFAVSSGTSSGTTKYIPLSREMVQSNTKAGTDLLVHHVRNNPNSRLLGGKSFMLGGSTDFVEQAPGIWSGDLSGIAATTMPWWARQRTFPDRQTALLKDWEQKIETFTSQSLREDIRLIGGVPSWMLIYFDKLFAKVPQERRNLRSLFPHLEMIVHGGVNFTPYQKQFEDLLSGTQAELREVYPASEGFIAVADRRSGEGLRVILDHGIFFEFVPFEELQAANPTRHWIGNVEPGVNYAVILSTCAGLWSYIIGDTVRFVDTKVPRLLVTGRVSYYLSAFGEHLIAEEIEDGISSAAAECGLVIHDFSVGAVYPATPADLGGHLYIVEAAEAAPDATCIARFSSTLDRTLCRRNEDYEAHRAGGYGLKAPEVIFVAPGFFSDWMKSRGKLGGQHKVPRIISNPELFSELQQRAHGGIAAR